MRYIAIFLLLANIGYFAWVHYAAQPVASPTPAAPRPLLNSGLTLVSEYEAQLAARPALICFPLGRFNSTDVASSFIAAWGDALSASNHHLPCDPLIS